MGGASVICLLSGHVEQKMAAPNGIDSADLVMWSQAVLAMHRQRIYFKRKESRVIYEPHNRHFSRFNFDRPTAGWWWLRTIGPKEAWAQPCSKPSLSRLRPAKRATANDR